MNYTKFDETLIDSTRFNFQNYMMLVFTTKSNIGWVLKLAMPTGWAILLILTIMVICSLPFIRRKGHFQVFFQIFIFD